MSKIKKIITRLLFRLFISLRYLKNKKRGDRINIIFLSIFLGITLGLMTLIVVIGVMNGFQENHITRRIEIGSYHISVSLKNKKAMDIETALTIKQQLYDNFNEFEAVVPFSDRQSVIRSKKGFYTDEDVIKIRAIDPDEAKKDSKFIDYLQLNKDFLDLDFSSIILGKEMFNSTVNRLNDIIYLTPDISYRSYKSNGVPFKITDYFISNSYDYDRYWGFISIYSLKNLTGKNDVDNIGIKLKSKKHKNLIAKKIKNFLGNDYRVLTDEEINSGYFTALRLEKIMILFLFIIIFLMISANTFSAIKLTIIERKQDIAILKATGASPNDIEIIFIIESIILGFFGSLFGILLGILVAYNIDNIFFFVELLINNIYKYIIYLFSGIFTDLEYTPIKIYDTSIYYQQKFPVKINFLESLIICFSIMLMTIFAALIPITRASKQRPIEIIKN